MHLRITVIVVSKGTLVKSDFKLYLLGMGFRPIESVNLLLFETVNST